MTSTAVRRVLAALSLVGTSALLLLVAAAPATADTPEPRPGNWHPEPNVDLVEALLLFGGIPLLVMLVITAIYVGPALARGEDLSPNALELENQWLGGPRKSAGELAAPDDEGSKAGGAGGSW